MYKGVVIMKKSGLVITALLVQLLLLFFCDSYELGLLARWPVYIHSVYVFILKPLSLVLSIVPFFIVMFWAMEVKFSSAFYKSSLVASVAYIILILFNFVIAHVAPTSHFLPMNMVTIYVMNFFGSFFFAVALHQKLFLREFGLKNQ